MNTFHVPFELRWADMDPNFHLRHDAFYVLGAQARVEWLIASGITPGHMQQLNLGPILFREECVFKRELRLGQKVEIRLFLSKARMDGARWSMRHEFIRDDGTLCAVLTTDGAWIDTKLRKLTSPPRELMERFLALPRTQDFEELPLPADPAVQG